METQPLSPQNRNPVEPSGESRWSNRLMIPLILMGLLLMDFGPTLMQYQVRINYIKTHVKPGMTKDEVFKALPHPFVIGYNNNAYYVEVKTRRPWTIQAAIKLLQVVHYLPNPYNRLLPLEMCLVHRDDSGLVAKGHYLDHWWGK